MGYAGGRGASRAGYGASGALLEREAELWAIEEALSRAQKGSGSVVLVEGHPGIGKSRLLEVAGEQASAADAQALTAFGSELERDFPFAVVLQLYGPLLGGVDSERREELLSGAAELARPLFEGGPERSKVPEEQTFALLYGLHWLTANLADERPVVLVIDDLHWADRPSLRVIAYAAQRLDELSLLVLAAARPSEPEAPHDLLRQLRTHRSTRLLTPSALSEAAVEVMVRDRMQDAHSSFVQACARVTEGNPFLLKELLADLEARGVAPTSAAADEVGRRAPDSVLQAALARLARLRTGSSALARALAVLGPDARLRHAAELAGLSPQVAAEAADALAAAEIFRPGEPLAFVHPLMHSAIYMDIPEAQRARAHGAAARLLGANGAPVEAIAAHLLEASREGDPWAVERLREAAARSVRRGAADSAALYLARALEEPPPPALRADLLIELGEAEASIGRGDSIARFEEALGLIDDPRRRAEVLRRLGWNLQKSGDIGGAVRAFERGLAELERLPGAELATDLQAASLEVAHIGAALLAPGRAEEARRRALAVIAKDPGAALPAGERGLSAAVAMQLLFRCEGYDELIPLFERAYADGALLEDAGCDSPTLWHVVAGLSWCDALDRSETIIAEALERARHEGSVVMLALGLYARSWPRYWRGDLSGAAADAQAAVDAWSGEFCMYLPVAAYWLALSLLELGDIEAAGRALHFPDAEERWGHTALYGPLLVGEALVAMARGEHARAVELLERTARSVLAASVANPAVVPWRSFLSVARLVAGNRDGALAVAGEELELARRFGAPRPIGIALRALGLAEGGARGVALLQEAVDALRRSPAALELARTLVDLGAALRRQGERTAARERLREALLLTQRFGATALERRAHEELTAAGARPRRREMSGLESLTPSERRVAEMAARGMTNREIAQALFVTVKAVQWHLSHVYRKLGVAFRTDLPKALAGAEGREDPLPRANAGEGG